MNKRTDAREVAFKLIFEYLFSEEKNPQTLSDLILEYGLTTEQEYVHNVYNGVINNFSSLSSCIDKYSNGFSLERIFKVDKAILLTAMYEILHMQDIPYAVSVNEALNLSKKYSTEKSSAYINGILAKVNKDGNN